MESHNEESQNQRITQLEQSVAELRQTIDELKQQSTQASVDQSFAPRPRPAGLPLLTPRAGQSTVRKGSGFKLPARMRTGEYWLSRVGIGLLLFGVAFLFKYSIDRGWITPWLRVGFGFAVGAALGYLGLKIYFKRPGFAKLLLGSCIATWYITGFSAFQLLELVSHSQAMGFMVAVTVVAFVLSLRQKEGGFSLIGAVGGLGTPFLLYTGSGNLPGLILYTCLILTGTSAMFFFKGWRSLLWLSVIGGWIVFGTALNSGINWDSPQVFFPEQVSMQLGLIFAWLAFWAVPVGRELFWINNPTRWLQSSVGFGDKSPTQSSQDMLARHLHLLSVSTPLIALAMSITVWQQLSGDVWGLITLALAGIYGAAFSFLRRWDALRTLAYTHALTGLLLFTIALGLLLDGDTLLIALAGEAIVLHLLARGLTNKSITVYSHILYSIIALWMILRLAFDTHQGTPILNPHALSSLWVVASVFLSSLLLKHATEKLVYRIAGHIALLGWFAAELSQLSNGQAWVSIAWGLYGAVLLVLGLRMDVGRLRLAALATLMLLAGKLFLVDLARLETIWRVLLFIGVGGVFLLLSYYFRSMWKKAEEQ